jgi:hypothetical protein
MVRYARDHPESNDTAVKNFRNKFKLDLIEVPEEFKGESTEDLDSILVRDRRHRRVSMKAKNRIDMSKYEAWICTDRQVKVVSAN